MDFAWLPHARPGLRNVTGWVHNSSDGSVEAVFGGERDAVEALVHFCEHTRVGQRP